MTLPSKIPSVNILGIPVSIVNMPEASRLVTNWAEQPQSRVVFVREVASLMVAVGEKRLANLHRCADLVVADGNPLVWVARMRGWGRRIGRIAGADFVDAICKRSLETGQSHYFFGGKPKVAELMAAQLCLRYPGLKVAGTFSPPMREIGPNFELDAAAINEIERIQQSGADFVWVGISSPKQEYWMMKARPLLGHGVLIGVGAAFDFQAGTVKRAPRWMCNIGLEWAHRLCSEPRRLWRRYLILAPKFLIAVAVEQITGRWMDDYGR